jgi:hypothetical protein
MPVGFTVEAIRVPEEERGFDRVKFATALVMKFAVQFKPTFTQQEHVVPLLDVGHTVFAFELLPTPAYLLQGELQPVMNDG